MQLSSAQDIFWAVLSQVSFFYSLTHTTMRIFLLSACLLLGSLAFAQQKETRNVSGFNQVAMSGSYDMKIIQGTEERLILEGDPEVLSNIETEVEGKLLRIKRKKNKWGDEGWDSGWNNNKRVTITLYCREMEAISLSGSGDIDASSGLRSDKLALSTAGSGDIKAKLQVKRLNVSIAGSGEMELTGEADEMNISAAGSGDIRALDLRTKECSISSAGSSDSAVNVSDKLAVSISGSGDVRYKGRPRLDKLSVSGSGSVRSVE